MIFTTNKTDMKNKTIPIKTSFSKEDSNKWNVSGVDFMPFTFQDKFAESINAICKIISKSNLNAKDEFLETLEKAKSFACSTIIPDHNGEFSRVFFDTPSDLRRFVENLQETEDGK